MCHDYETSRIFYDTIGIASVDVWKGYHVRYLSHLALQVGSSKWVHKTQIHSIQRCRHFGAETRCSAFLLEMQLHPSLYWIRYSRSGSTIILYYKNLSVSWYTLLRNQISFCQHVFIIVLSRLWWVMQKSLLTLSPGLWLRHCHDCWAGDHHHSKSGSRLSWGTPLFTKSLVSP